MEDTSLLFVDSNNRDTVLYPSGNSYTLHLTTPIRNITKVDLICAKVPNTSFNLQASSNLVINGSSNVVMLPGFYSTSSFCSEFNNSNQTTTKVNYSDAEGLFIFYSSTLSSVSASGQLANIIGFTSQTAFAASSNPAYTTSTVYSGMNLIKSPRIVNLTTNDYVWLDVEELRTPTSVDAKNIVNVNQTSNNITYSTVTSTVPPISAQTLPLTLDVPAQSGQTTIDLPVDLYGASVTSGYVCTGAFGAAPLKQVSYGLPSLSLAGFSTTCNKYGTFVFAGQNSSNYTTSICSSGDGISWVRGDTISHMYGQSITSSPLTGRFVMVGSNSDLGVYPALTNKAVYSDDGITWYSVTLPLTQFWRCVTCSPVTGRFVAISAGYYSSTQGVYSDDGEHWYPMSLPSSQLWNALSVNAVGRFVSLVQSSNIGAYSDDGQNWIQITLPLSRIWYSLICSPNGRWVGIAPYTNQGIYSNNGRTWYPMSLPSIKPWFPITCNSSGRFILCPYQSSQGAYSDDGINWNPLDVLLPTLCMTCSPVSGRFVSVWNNGTYSDDGLTWKESFPLPSTISPGNYGFIVYNPISRVYITCNDTYILYSKSYKNWTPTYNIGNIKWTAAACGTTGRFVIFGVFDGVPHGINVALYSDNGIKWNEITLPTSQSWSSVTCCSHGAYSGRFVAIAGNPQNYGIQVSTDTGVYSDDGVHWTSMTLNSSESWTSIICSQTTGRFFASSIFKGAYSDDGVNWTLIDSLNGVLSSCPTGTYTGRIVCISHTVLTYSDNNGVNWVPCTTTSVDMDPVISVTCSPVSGRFVAVGSNKYGAYSDDGDNWIQMTLDTMNRKWTSVICNTDGQFIAVSKLYSGGGEQSSFVAVYSDDGINWLPITTTATISYSLPFAGYITGTNFTFTPTIDSVTVDNTSSMKVGDAVQGYPDSKVTAISGNTVTFQVATPQSFPFIYIGSTFATYRSSNLSFQTYSSSTSSTSFAMIPMDVPSGYVKIFKENTDYGVSVTYPSRIDKLSRVTVRWLDNYGQPISFNTFDNNSFTLRIHSTRMVPEVERPLTLPAPVPLPKPQKMVAWISIAVLILGLLIITFMKNSIK